VLDGLDGQVTTDPGVLLTISVADCIPVYIVEPKSGAVGLLHAGWRGTADGILARGLAVITGATSVTSDKLVIHCGIGICGKCYEVGSEVAARFISPAPAGHTHVDLREILRAQARAAGVREVTVSPWCSAHDRDRFFSHRASGGRDGRMVAYIGRPRT
jgi:YfiH family protein